MWEERVICQAIRHLSGQTLKSVCGCATQMDSGLNCAGVVAKESVYGSTTRYVGYITNVVNVTILTNVIATSCISLCKRCLIYHAMRF